jgi:hypothetical protein
MPIVILPRVCTKAVWTFLYCFTQLLTIFYLTLLCVKKRIKMTGLHSAFVHPPTPLQVYQEERPTEVPWNCPLNQNHPLTKAIKLRVIKGKKKPPSRRSH